MLIKKIISVSFILLFYISMANAKDPEQHNFERQTLEAIIKLKAGQRAINTRIDDMKNEVNTRFNDVNKRFNDVNKRFDDVNTRFDDVNTRFDDLFSLILGGFGILFAGIFGLIGYIIWDRNHALEKIKKEVITINKNERLSIKGFIIEEIKKQFDQFSLKRKLDLSDPTLALT